MEELALVLCMIGAVLTYPMYPQSAGTHGIASMSLETLQQQQQQQAANKLTALPQFSRFGYNDPYSTLWLHGLLPPHTSFPWLHQRPQMPDNQQFEYALPIHPPPLPGVVDPAKSGQDAQAGKQKQLTTEQLMQPLLPLGYPNQVDPTLIPPKGGPADGQIQTVALFMYQTIMNKLLQQGAVDHVPDPAAVPPVQQHPYPGLFFMNYGAGPAGAPARLGVMSSEEMQAGRAGAAHALNSLYPGLLGSGFGRLPQSPALGGDFTIEDDSPGAGINPAGQGAAKNPMENPSIPGSNPSIPGLEGLPPSQGDAMLFPNINQPNMAFNPLGQSKFPTAVTPAYTPKVTLDAAPGFGLYGMDETLTFGMQREIPSNVDVTHTNNGIDSPIMHSDIHLQHHYFQEP
ncbi:ameloblastin [Pristimantis euphronides]